MTSNKWAGMLRVAIPFGKPRAGGKYSTCETAEMLGSELGFPRCSVKLFQNLPSLQTLWGGHENNIRIFWLVPDLSTGTQDELLSKVPKCQGSQMVLETKGFTGVVRVRQERSLFSFGLYTVCTLDGMLENRHMQVAPPIGILCSLVHETVT